MLNVKLNVWISRGLVAAIAAGGIVALIVTKPWASGEAPVTFSTVTVSKGSIAAKVTANGTLSARTTVQVGAQVTGRVVELHADFNDHVTKGEIIAKLDESVLRAQIQQAQANLDQAVANLAKARVAEMDGKRQYDRQVKLREQQLVADLTVETAEVTWKSAIANTASMVAQVEQAKASLDQAKTNLSYATISSPVDGTVLTRSYDIGQTVQASLSAPTLFTIAEDLGHMQIDTSVAEADVGRLQDKMKATFSVDAYPGRVFDGIVRQVRNSPTTVSGVVTYDAVIDVDNEKHELRPCMTANITFVLDQVADTIKIPNAALRFKPTRDQMMAIRERFGGGKGGGSGSGRHHRDGSGSSDGSGAGSAFKVDGSSGASGGGVKMNFGDKKPVWKLVDGKPKMVLIKPGLTDGTSTQLVEGELEPGDQLITEIIGLPTAPANQRKVGF